MIAIQRRAVVDEYRQFSFQRGSVAFDSRGRLYYPHQARFETVNGRAGVLVEEGTQNLLGSYGILDTDSNGDGIANGWNPNATGSATGIRSMDSANATFGRSTCQRIERTGGASGDQFGISTSVTGVSTPNKISALVKVESLDPGAAVTLYADYFRSDNTWVQFRSVQLTAPTDWVWVELPASSDPTAARANILIRIGGGNGVAYVQAVQVENKAYRTSFTNGTRAPETLTVPVEGLLDPNEGTIDMDVFVDSRIKDRSYYRDIFRVNRLNGSNGIVLYHSPDGYFAFELRDDGNTLSVVNTPESEVPNGWRRFTIRWSASEMALFVDGVKKASSSTVRRPSAFASQAYVGSGVGGAHTNTYIGPLRISRRARTDQEIADAYAAGTLTADADTTLLLPFTGPDAQRGARVLYVPAVGL